ncbi:MAG: class I SAM-dependent methyltransferase, partial [Lysobacterales bacterium]
LIGGFENAFSTFENEPKIREAFRTGEGVAWGDQAHCMFCAVARFFRPGYVNNLVQHWLPALDGVVEKLERGARVADLGCGHGHSTLLMATAFPNSTFIGYDFHEGSIEAAKQHRDEHALDEKRVRFEQATASDFEENDFDLVTCFDALHDMGDPAGTAAQVLKQLKPDGTWMVVEPMAADELSDNFNPVGRLFYAASTSICVPTALAQKAGPALGAQAGQRKLTEVITEGGFSEVRRAAETPFNIILEARP